MIKDIITLFMSKREFFVKLLLEHLGISLISIVIASFIGLIIGIIISEKEKSSKFILGIINFLYTIPSISLLGFLIPFSGIGNKTAIIALTIYALLPMVRNTYTGIENVDKRLIEAAEGMGSTKIQILFKLKLPLAMPVIMSGLRNMATMTIALGGIASFIGAGGLGVAIYRGITTNNSIMTLTGSLLIAFLALVVDFTLGIIERFICRRKAHRNHKKISILILIIFIIIVLLVYYINIGKKDNINIASKPMT